jgi:hypothetical protein
VLHQPQDSAIDHRPTAEVHKRWPETMMPPFHDRGQTASLQPFLGT